MSFYCMHTPLIRSTSMYDHWNNNDNNKKEDDEYEESLSLEQEPVDQTISTKAVGK